jgi:hypothetical protein
MKGIYPPYRLTFLVISAAILLALGIFMTLQMPGQVQAAPEPLPMAQMPDNSQCLACHSTPGQVFQLPNGDTLSTYVDEKAFAQGVHSSMSCQLCHSNIVSYPHPQNVAKSAKEYTLQYKDTCNQCHATQAQQTMDNAHGQLAAQGNENTPTCANCHTPHATEPILKDANGDPAPTENAKIAMICSKCHSAIVEQYKNSVHGAALFDEANLDVPACGDCHGIHNLKPARSTEFRLDSPLLCSECHSRADIMDKYGISTAVTTSYVSDFHGTTVTLFEKQSPELETNKAVCYDCHGVHDIAAADDPNKGLMVKQNLIKACQRCHPGANANFPDSWLSHYIPDQQRYPVVYYVNLFYQILIPTVLGGMALFLATDIFRRLSDRLIRKPAESTKPDGKKEG